MSCKKIFSSHEMIFLIRKVVNCGWIFFLTRFQLLYIKQYPRGIVI